jgi:hypothetical protein
MKDLFNNKFPPIFRNGRLVYPDKPHDPGAEYALEMAVIRDMDEIFVPLSKRIHAATSKDPRAAKILNVKDWYVDSNVGYRQNKWMIPCTTMGDATPGKEFNITWFFGFTRVFKDGVDPTIIPKTDEEVLYEFRYIFVDVRLIAKLESHFYYCRSLQDKQFEGIFETITNGSSVREMTEDNYYRFMMRVVPGMKEGEYNTEGLICNSIYDTELIRAKWAYKAYKKTHGLR